MHRRTQLCARVRAGLGRTSAHRGSVPGTRCRWKSQPVCPSGPRCRLGRGAATALFVAGLGSVGYAINTDLSPGHRILFWLLLGLIVFELVSLFISMPGADVIYAVLGLAIFGGYTVIDFNRMRRAGMDEAVAIAAGIFLDVVNILLFFLQLFGRKDQ